METTTTTPVELPVIHSPLDPEIAEAIGDDILLGSAAATKVAKVKRTRSNGWSTAPEVRGWSGSGRVD